MLCELKQWNNYFRSVLPLYTSPTHSASCSLVFAEVQSQLLQQLQGQEAPLGNSLFITKQMRMSLWRTDSLSLTYNDQLPLKPAAFKTQLSLTSHGVVIYTHQHKQQTCLKKHPPWPFCCLLGLCSIPAAPEVHCKDPVYTTAPQGAALTALLARQTSKWTDGAKSQVQRDLQKAA